MNAYLIDTNIFIIHFVNPRKLHGAVAPLLDSKKSKLYLSAISLIEVSLLEQKGKLPVSTYETYHQFAQLKNYHIAPLTMETCGFFAALPFHHKDPFDRLIIAEAQRLNVPVITTDRIFKSYLPDTIEG